MQQFFSFLGLFWKKVLAVSAVEVGVRSGKEEGVSLRLGLPHSAVQYFRWRDSVVVVRMGS